MKRFILLILVCLTAPAFAESISDGTGYDSGAMRNTTLHNSIGGLNAGEYQHLTTGEKTVSINGSGTVDFAAKVITAYNDLKFELSMGIQKTTVDGSDIYYTFLSGGGDDSVTRGATIRAYGNEHTTYPGQMRILAGSVASGSIVFLTNNASRLEIDNSGVATFTGNLNAAANLDVGGTFTIDGEDVLGDIAAALAAILGS